MFYDAFAGSGIFPPDGGMSNARAMWREEILDGVEELYKGGSALGALVVYGEMAEPGRQYGVMAV